MRSRPLGVILVILGIVMMAYTGFNFVTREKVVDIGPLEIKKTKQSRALVSRSRISTANRWSCSVGE